MARTSPRIRKFRSSCIGRFRPTTDLNLRELVIDKIIQNLYSPHWNYWFKKLAIIIAKNCDAQNRQGTTPLTTFGIFYAGQSWYLPIFEHPILGKMVIEESSVEILQLSPDVPGLEKDLLQTTINLSELDVETYEVKRFLAGLLLFPAPGSIMEALLGSALYGRIKGHYQELAGENANHIWNDATAFAFHTYAKEHDYLIDAMCQRVMMNLLAQQAFAER